MNTRNTCFAILVYASLAVGQAQDVTGTLEGQVTDSLGQPIAGANVTLNSSSLQGTRGVNSDERGTFHLLYLPPGRYRVRVSHIAYSSAVINNVVVRVGRTTSLGEIRLEQRAIQLGEVNVSEERTLLDPSSTVVGENVAIEDISVLPLERNYRSVATLLPHSNQSFLGDEVNIAGASGAENRYYINGTDVTDSYRGITGTNLPYNFIREIQVKAGGYEPEYRSSLGGILNVVTYSGSNEFSGQVFGFYANNNFSAEQQLPATAPPQGAYSQYDFGFSLGGPVVPDNLWFFVAYSPNFRNEDVSLPGLGYYPAKTRSNPFAARLTWKASESLDFAATVLGDPTTEDAVGKSFWAFTYPVKMTNPDPFLADVVSGGYGVSAEGHYIASSNVLLQAAFSWTSRKNKYGPATARGKEEPFFYDAETGTLSGGYDEVVDITSTTSAISVAATVSLRLHTLKAGLEYKDVGLDSYNKDFPIWRFSDSSFIAYDISQVGTIHNRLPSVFVQDSWVVSDNFRLNGGVRWDGLFLVASNGQVTQRILGQFQPRLGVVFLPGGNETEKLSLSVGRFAEDLLTFGSTLYQFGQAYQIGRTYTHDPRFDPSGADTAFYYGGFIQPEVKSLLGQYYDEVTVGYERTVGLASKFTARGVYRTLREIIEDGEDPPGSGTFYYANPGRPPLSSFPKPKRDYLALELSLEASLSESFSVIASYVLSRNYGNYVGLYDQDGAFAIPNAGPQYDYVDMMDRTTGLLPNDRTHVLKLNGSYRSPIGLNIGAAFLWQSGTPVNELGASTHGTNWPIFLRQRGTSGRLPSIWDLNLRFTYDISSWLGSGLRPRLILDVFHVGNQRTVVMKDQMHYFNQDAQGNQIDPNPTYGQPLKFMPSRSIRLGMEVNF